MSRDLLTPVTFRYGNALPGVFVAGHRISFWPAGLEPTQRLVDLVVLRYFMHKQLVTTQQIIAMNNEDAEDMWE